MSLQVYLVDDDAAVREALSLLLQTVGLDVRSFAAPGDFLRALDGLKPGCLVLDIRMPQISGLKLQENLGVRGVDWPVIVISGHGDIEAEYGSRVLARAQPCRDGAMAKSCPRRPRLVDRATTEGCHQCPRLASARSVNR